MVRRAISCFVVSIVALAGCGSDKKNDDRCAAGAVRACDLADGGRGVETCGSDFRWTGTCAEAMDDAGGGSWLAMGRPPIAPPALSPCPTGWQEVGSPTEATTCEPWPAGEVTCGADEARIPGEGCVRVGPECPADGWPADLPTDRPVVYVREGAAAGDGSRALPYGALTEFALGGLSSGTVVAIAVGRYDSATSLPSGISLVGACVAETVLTAPRSPNRAVVSVLGTETEIRSLRLADTDRIGLILQRGSSVTVQDVVIDSVQITAIKVDPGASLDARGLVVRDTRSSGALLFGRGIEVLDGHVDVRRADVADNHETAVIVGGAAATLILEDAVVHGTRSRQSDLQLGRAIHLQEGATATLARVAIEDNRTNGVFATDAGTAMSVDQMLVRDTSPQESDGLAGRGVVIQRAATAEITRGAVLRSAEAGVQAVGADVQASLADVVIRDTAGRPVDGLAGRGLTVELGARLDAARVVIERSAEIGMIVVGPITTAAAEDLLVRDTLGRPDGEAGRGVGVELGELTLTRGVIERSRQLGMYIAGTDAQAALTDLAVIDVAPSACADTTCPTRAGGHALASITTASTVVDRFVFGPADTCGVLIGRDGQLDLSNGVVRGCAIGACVQVGGYDTTRLSEGVAYEDVATPIEATDLPIPDVLVPGA